MGSDYGCHIEWDVERELIVIFFLYFHYGLGLISCYHQLILKHTAISYSEWYIKVNTSEISLHYVKDAFSQPNRHILEMLYNPAKIIV